jgi:hypothetical protein
MVFYAQSDIVHYADVVVEHGSESRVFKDLGGRQYGRFVGKVLRRGRREDI